jgi:hypothetical protein
MMATEHQVGQLRAVIDIREQRLERALMRAQEAVVAADAAVLAARQNRDRQATILREAKAEVAKAPGCEPTWFWRDLCLDRLSVADREHFNAGEQLDEAHAALSLAQHDMRQMKERGSRISDLGKTLRRASIRAKEQRAEDDMAMAPASAAANQRMA